MIDQINEAIEKHLPSQVGESLRGRLEKLAELEATVNDCNELIEKLKEENQFLSEKNTSLTKTIEATERKSLELSAREAQLEEKELSLVRDSYALKADKLEAEVAVLKESQQANLRLVETIFRNPQVKRTLTSSGFENTPGTPENNFRSSSSNTNKTITETVEEVEAQKQTGGGAIAFDRTPLFVFERSVHLS